MIKHKSRGEEPGFFGRWLFARRDPLWAVRPPQIKPLLHAISRALLYWDAVPQA